MAAMTAADSALGALPVATLPDEAWSDRLFTGVGLALDAVVVEAMRRVIDRVLMPSAAELPALRAAAAPFLSGPLRDDPRRYFAFLRAPVAVVEPVTDRQRRHGGGVISSRRFASAYQPYAADPTAANDSVLVEHWTHEPGPPRGTVLALHGFSMGQPRLDAWALFASSWFARGLDVALLTLPYHGARTPAGARFSGQRFADPNPATMHEAVRRAVYEIELVRAWLIASGGGPVGLLGLSLGGYLTALVAGLVDDLAFAIPMVPPVCIGDLAWRFLGAQRHGAAAYSHAELRAMYRVHSPLTFPLRLERRRTLIIAGRGDRIVPPEHPHALWEHWGRPAIHWFSGSHLAPFGRDRIIAAVSDHLRRLEIL
ncbi:alpha/beta hydrolase family protein [bacterium]|nr:alpha/beta hydrolase family protein [bacterium]